MVGHFTLVMHKPHKVIGVQPKSMNDINKKIYSKLTENGVSSTSAIDAANWAEVACIGESYNEEMFDIYVENN